MKTLFRDQFTNCTQGIFLEKRGQKVLVVLERKGKIYDIFEEKMIIMGLGE